MDRRRQLIEQAWIGDAVLSLYVRLKVLREDQAIDGAKSARMTSNQFLGTFGEPTEVEAQIGRVYASGGLDEAFAWIEREFGPAFDRQQQRQGQRQAVQR